MAATFDHASVVESLATHGHWDAMLDLDNELRSVRFHRSVVSGNSLSDLQAPPAYDADLQNAVDRLRNQLKKALNVTSGPPVLLTQALAAAFGYHGNPITSTAEGLRLLLQVPDLETADLTSMFTFPQADAPASTVLPSPSADTARLDRLESTIARLQAGMTKSIAEAIQQALAPKAPTKPLKGKASKAAPALDVTDVDMTGPSNPHWEFKSGSHVMEVLGSVYTQLLAIGSTELAAELYSIRAEVDYAFMLPTEASDDEPPENVYVAKHSGRRWKRDHPAPDRCYECKGHHWRENCPQAARKSEETTARALQKGAAPPARYYISKGGQAFDTSRRPLQECKKCAGKFHWFWNCPRGPTNIYIPRGASFKDKIDGKPVNASAARFSKAADTTTDADATTDSSATVAEILPVKRPRKISHRTRESTTHDHTTAPQPAAYPYPSQSPYPNPWGWYPPAMWNAPPWAAPPNYPQAPQPMPDAQRINQRAPHFSDYPTPGSNPPPQAYSQWSNAQQPPQPPPPPPSGAGTHQPYTQLADGGAAHPASY